MSEELKNCPFCGGIDIIVSSEFIERAPGYGYTIIRVGHGVTLQMKCDASVTGNNKADAIAAWNRRAPAAPTDGDELAFNAQRLRNVAALVGLTHVEKLDDATLDGARGAILGQIAGKLRVAPTDAQPEDIIAIAAHIFGLKPHKMDEEHKAKYLRFASEVTAARCPHAQARSQPS